MVADLIVLGGLAAAVYLVNKKNKDESIQREIDRSQGTGHIPKAKKLGNTLAAQRAAKIVNERKRAEKAEQRRIELRNAHNAIVKRAEAIAADTTQIDAYREDAAKFAAQQKAKDMAAAAKKKLADAVTRAKIIVSNASGNDTKANTAWRTDAAKFAHQEKRRAEGWTKAQWQAEWRSMIGV